MSETSAREQAHDVLAAEAFAMPARDPNLRANPVVLPDDPSGIAEPHDVLAAEEFAMPAARVNGALESARASGPWWLGVRAVLGIAIALLVVRALRRH